VCSVQSSQQCVLQHLLQLCGLQQNAGVAFAYGRFNKLIGKKLGGKNPSRATTDGKVTLGVAGGINKLSCNFIISMDHIYEDGMKLQNVIIPKKGSYSNAKWSIM